MPKACPYDAEGSARWTRKIASLLRAGGAPALHGGELAEDAVDAVDAVDAALGDVEGGVVGVVADGFDVVGAFLGLFPDFEEDAVFGVEHHRIAPGDEGCVVDARDDGYGAVVDLRLHAVACDGDGHLGSTDGHGEAGALVGHDAFGVFLQGAGECVHGEQGHEVFAGVAFDGAQFGFVFQKHLAFAIEQPVAVEVGEDFFHLDDFIFGERSAHGADVSVGESHSAGKLHLAHADSFEKLDESIFYCPVVCIHSSCEYGLLVSVVIPFGTFAKLNNNFGYCKFL